MRASKLRQVIVFEKFIMDDSNPDYPKKRWLEVHRDRCDFQELSTRDSMIAQQVGSSVVARAVLRLSSDSLKIDHSMRAYIFGKYFQVNGTPRRNLGDNATFLTVELKEGLKEWL